MAHDDDSDDIPVEKVGFSRRTFLRGSAGGAALTGLLTLTSKARAAAEPAIHGPGTLTSTSEAYGCLSTMEAFGPDDGYVHATVCQGARSCCRIDE